MFTSQREALLGGLWQVKRGMNGSVFSLTIVDTAGPSASPDFLLVLVALANSMRLSLMKAAHAALSGVAWQEIRVRSG
jgi:hypothetical protein